MAIGRILFALALFAAGGTAAGEPLAKAPKLTVYLHASLIDGTGAPPRADMAVVVEGQRIRAVETSAAALHDYPSADKVDMSGRWVLPGLINTHEHLATPPNRTFALAMMRRDLYGGVTALRDMADDLRAMADLKRAALIGEVPGPDIYYAALMAGPEFFKDPRTSAAAMGETPGKVPWMQAVDASTDWREAITLARGTGASAIKAYADMPPEVVRALVAEAHRQHIPVWAHAMIFPTTPKQELDAGVDAVSHVCMLAYQASDVKPRAYHDRAPVQAEKFAHGDNPEVQALLDEMKRNGQVLDATLYVYQAMEQGHAEHPKGPAPYCSLDLAARLANQALRAGVSISAGTDDFSPQSDPWPALQGELILLVDNGGMTPMQAIVAATLNGAKAANQEAEMGSITPGKLANLIFVTADPSRDIRALKTIALTVKRGAPYPRADYRPVTAEEMKEGQ